ncbi:hypothetical protein BDD12DRAFT_805734 [Trichophaea hybrida]|nr:hypothetical protein BDD12DRAFT_805734 [Trichophaea hybrida]
MKLILLISSLFFASAMAQAWQWRQRSLLQCKIPSQQARNDAGSGVLTSSDLKRVARRLCKSPFTVLSGEGLLTMYGENRKPWNLRTMWLSSVIILTYIPTPDLLPHNIYSACTNIHRSPYSLITAKGIKHLRIAAVEVVERVEEVASRCMKFPFEEEKGFRLGRLGAGIRGKGIYILNTNLCLQ